MRVQTGVSRRSSQALVISEWDVLISPRIFVSFSQAVIDYIYIMLTLANADKIIVGLDISMKKASRMNILYPLD